MTSFVLIGGAMHCGKHFNKLRPFLEAGGNEVITPDLPGLGEDKSDPKRQTLETHVAAIVAAVDGATKKPVVLVGHSLAGVSISAAAEAKPEAIKRLVFLSAETRPGPDWGQTATNPGPQWLSEGLMEFPDGMMAAAEGKAERLSEFFYSGAPPEDIKALAKLLRPQPGYDEKGLALTDARYGSVPKAYVKTLRDLVNLPVHQDTWHARLGNGVPKFELDCGHGSFVSNPEQLAAVLKQIAAIDDGSSRRDMWRALFLLTDVVNGLAVTPRMWACSVPKPFPIMYALGVIGDAMWHQSMEQSDLAINAGATFYFAGLFPFLVRFFRGNASKQLKTVMAALFAVNLYTFGDPKMTQAPLFNEKHLANHIGSTLFFYVASQVKYQSVPMWGK